jgi:hypothetical protein
MERTLETRALALSVEGLLKLLGGTSEERLRFFEIWKGITTPAEFQLANQQIAVMDQMVTILKTSAENMSKTAGMVGKT